MTEPQAGPTARLLQPRVFLILFSVIYLLATLYLAGIRPLWYDELFTFHIVGQGGPEKIWAALRTGLDPNPPVIYVATYISQALFGTGPVATRLPAILGFLLLVISVYRFASFRLPTPFALQATVFVALTGAYTYAYEARAYGLLLGFGGLAVACWQRRQARALAGALSVALLTHCYSVMFLPPLFVGELVRTWQNRKIDWPVWLALTLPCGIIACYFPLMRSTQQVALTGPIFDPTLAAMIGSYRDLLLPALLPGLATLALIGAMSLKPARRRGSFEMHEWAALGVLALAPLMALVVSSIVKGGYFTRYGLGACIPIAVGVAWVSVTMVGPEWRHARLLPILAVACFGGLFLWEFVQADRRPPGAELASKLQSNTMPLVIADGQTFLQLDHYMDARLAGRLMFLTDNTAALHYAGTNCYDAALRAVQPWFPLRGRLVPYRQFLARREPFLVYGKSSPQHSWIWQGLKDEGISFQLQSQKDGMQLIAVTP